MAGAFLTLNTGSSSIKFGLFDEDRQLLLRGEVEKTGGIPHFRAADRTGKILAEERWQSAGRDILLARLLAWLDANLGGRKLIAAGHRIVHGGEEFTRPVRLDANALAALQRLVPFAPLHQPHNLAAVQAVARLRPGLPQIGCFDTAFHASMTGAARRFALPKALEQEGIRRFGFHGLSFEYIAGHLKTIAPDIAKGRIVIAHLGSGASLCAIKNGLSLDTTMSFSPLDGLVMGTRCGALDPGVLLYLMERGMDHAALQDLLYNRSGLLGVSGVSDDMRVLLASSDRAAEEAVELFVFRVAREIAALTASLGGLDGLVFTGGIGENSAEIRERVAARLGWLGVCLNPEANQAASLDIGAGGWAVRTYRIPTDEEAVIVRHTASLAGPGAALDPDQGRQSVSDIC